MSKKVKICIALFLAFAVLVQYSFSPQALFAYGLSNTAATTQAEEQEPTKATEAEKATKAEDTDADKSSSSDKDKGEAADKEEPSDAGRADDADKQDGKDDGDKDADKYPAASFSDSAGGVAVNVEAPEGAFPEGTRMVVKAVEHSNSLEAKISKAVGSEIEDYKAVDITFYKGDKEIQPEAEVQVHLNASGLDAETENDVIHISDSGKAEVIAEASADGEATVTAEHFSTYIISSKVKSEFVCKLP